MFTQGLDKSQLRWVRECQSLIVIREVPFSNSTLRSRNDPITGIKGASGRGFGLPPPSKFRSGHLPANAIPVSTVIPDETGDSASNSGNDDSIESEEEVYGGRYSLDSSPQDHRAPNGAARRYGNGNLTQRGPRYASDYTYSEVSSSRETLVGRPGAVRDPLMRAAANVRQSGFTEDDSSDSAASSEFSTTHVGGSINGPLPRSKAYVSEGQTNEKIPTSGVHAIPNEAESSILKSMSGDKMENHVGDESHDQFVRTATGSEPAASSNSNPPRLPTFHASALGPWHGVIAYDACVRLCLHAWAMQCMEAPMFLENECSLLRDAFGLRQVLLQSEDELMVKCNQELSSEGVAPKPKKLIGKMKVQVRKVKMGLDPPTGCSMSSLMTNKIKMEYVRHHLSHLQSKLSSGWQALRRIRFAPHLPANGSLARQSLAYVHASTRYLQQVSGLLKVGVTTLRSSSSSYEVVQEINIKVGSNNANIKVLSSIPTGLYALIEDCDSLGDDLLVEVQDSKGKHFGRVLVQVATIADNPADKVRWWPIYREPDHELVGNIQLYIIYSTSADDNSHLKCGSVAETVAYDLVLEVAMKVQGFQQRNLSLHGPWKWLLTEFASYYGVSEIYTKLRYLSYVMDVATPTADCLNLVYNLLAPVIMKGNGKTSLSHQENRILGETKDEIEQILTLVFENYKSLDESHFSGISEVFRPASGRAAPALEPAVKLYKLLHDILSPEAQTAFCHYFQVLGDNMEAGPSSPVADLVIATSDFQRDLSSWNISPIKGGVDAKELFHLYILVWIQDKRLSLLETCKLDKVKWSGVRTQHSTTPFVDDMYERLKETLTDYEAIADIEKAVVEALDKQYADVLSPLKESMAPKKFGLKYMQKLAKRSTCAYVVPDELGILLNSLKRMLDVLRPRLESQFKSWGSCLPNAGNSAPGERLSEVTVMLRAKFRNYLQTIVEKLVEN
ncbi:hypothetical protein SESBI_42978, partial [Sesbania bispinosa]